MATTCQSERSLSCLNNCCFVATIVLLLQRPLDCSITKFAVVQLSFGTPFLGVCALQQLNHGGWVPLPTLSTFSQDPPPSHGKEVEGAPDGVSTSNSYHNLHCCGKVPSTSHSELLPLHLWQVDYSTPKLLKIDIDTLSPLVVQFSNSPSATTLTSILFERQPCVSLGCKKSNKALHTP